MNPNNHTVLLSNTTFGQGYMHLTSLHNPTAHGVTMACTGHSYLHSPNLKPTKNTGKGSLKYTRWTSVMNNYHIIIPSIPNYLQTLQPITLWDGYGEKTIVWK